MIGAARLAAALDLPAPTPEQAAVIEAPLMPAVIVAGAGSGKTETMAARVVWLVANRLVAPDAVLGLTFTRKAAGELAQRVRLRLAQFNGRAGRPATEQAGGEPQPGEPTVLTYHGYAARLVVEHALRVPVEPSVRLLTEATTWQLAEKIVRAYDGELPHVTWTPATVVDAVLALAGELAEHLRPPADVRAWTDELVAAVGALPRAADQRGADLPAGLRALMSTQLARAELLPLVERYTARKRERDAMDFGDQMSLAARIADRFPAVGAGERTRYRVVLLDEYQDTGHAQRVLLRALFGGGHPVTAVGDPAQSIYGWRGASAGNLARFPLDFPAAPVEPPGGDPGPPGAAAAVFPLTVSFRNAPRILTVANRLAEPLRGQAGVAAGRDLAVARLRAHVTEPAGAVVCALHETVVDEATWVADQMASRWGDPADRRNGAGAAAGPTAAVLVRRRSLLPRLERALRERGLPVEVVGLGGLLDTPEVRDIVATLRVLDDPAAGDALVRLLTGARWQIGPRDLAALGRRARALVPRGEAAAEPAADPPVRSRAGPPDPDRSAAAAPAAGAVSAAALIGGQDVGSLVEALDAPGAPEQYSPAGYARLRALAAELRGLRGRLTQPLPDLVADVERTIGVGVEVAARPGRDAAVARAHLDRFLDVAADFADGAGRADTAGGAGSADAAGGGGGSDWGTAGLGAFLAYLAAAAEREDGLEPGIVEVEPDRIQLLTVHGAKGLEWDLVAVAGLAATIFPAPARGGEWTRDPRALPHQLRGDAADLPLLELAAAEDQKGLDAARAEHVERCAAAGALEERRLAYVAATRARRVLWCSGYWWDEAARPRGPSPYLVEIAEACRAETDDASSVGSASGRTVAVWADPPADGAANPLLAEPARRDWPVDPLGARRPDIEHAAALVRAALAADDPDRLPLAQPADQARPAAQQSLFDPVVPDAQSWANEVDLLLAERASATAGPLEVPLPAHLSVSDLVTLRRDPAELARRIRRPVPYRPAPLARRGTAFHAWLEERFGGERLLDIDELPGAADSTAAPDDDLVLLQQRFLASAWAGRRPEEVEVPFETVVGPVVVRGRIDAVFRDTDGGWTVVDWKTGAVPTGVAATAAQVQLATYRLAWADLSGSPVALVRAAFHYVRDDRTVRPTDLLDAGHLERLVWTSVRWVRPARGGAGEQEPARPGVGRTGGPARSPEPAGAVVESGG